MAYDEELAARVRDLLEGEAGLTEKKMFGGLGFMIGGNMAVAANSSGDLMVRVDPSEGERLAAETAAEPMEMRGRVMTGWLSVGIGHLADDAALEEWVGRGVAYAASLPAK